MPTNRFEAGFTLVEVVVALAVTAMLLAIILPPAITARERERGIQKRGEALEIASELIAKAQPAPFDENIRQGLERGLKWKVEETALARDPRGVFALARITATVETGRGSVVTLTTRKLKPIVQ